MKVVKKTKEYTVYQKGSGRFAVKNSEHNWVNGDDKVAILQAEGLVKKVAPAPAPVVEVQKAPTKAQLSKLTKKQIDDLAKLEWGIKLDARKSKDDMIKEFIKLAKAQIKANEADSGDDDEDEV